MILFQIWLSVYYCEWNRKIKEQFWIRTYHVCVRTCFLRKKSMFDIPQNYTVILWLIQALLNVLEWAVPFIKHFHLHLLYNSSRIGPSKLINVWKTIKFWSSSWQRLIFFRSDSFWRPKPSGRRNTWSS